MPLIDADAAFEPIKARIEGTVYTVTKVTEELMKRWAAQEKSGDETKLSELLGQVFDVDAAEFDGADMIKLAYVAKGVMNTLQDAVEGKINPTEEEALDSPQ